MPTYRLRTTALDEEGCAAVHAATLEILEKTGVEVQHGGALELLAGAGARVDGSRVRMPAALVDDALAAAPRSITLTSRGETGDLELKAGPVYYGTGSDCLVCLGPETRDRRPVSLDDVEQMAAVQEHLPNIEFVMSMAHPHELPAAFAPAAQFAAMLRGTSKPLIMVPEVAADIDLFSEMAAACGSAQSWALYAMPTPPLVHGEHSAARLIRCAELGVPMVYASATLQGATGPASRAGVLVQTNAEMLSGLVITELASPGAPYRVRRGTGRHEPAHGARGVLLARGDGHAAGLRRPGPVLRPAHVRLRRLLRLARARRAVGLRGRHDPAHRGPGRRHPAPRHRLHRVRARRPPTRAWWPWTRSSAG